MGLPAPAGPRRQGGRRGRRALEDKGRVTRRPHPAHGRIRPADLTPGGRAVLRACHGAAGAMEEQMLSGLSPRDRQQLEAALRACIAALT
jgi:DNA-binding MarR family transcriptional regulator